MSAKSFVSVVTVFYVLGTLMTIQIQCVLLDFNPERRNTEPIIGILAQVMSPELKSSFGNTSDYYIPASYVKFIESSGARVVPIWPEMEVSYYENIMMHINGVLLPGDAEELMTNVPYVNAASIICQIAETINLEDDYFPILGIGTGSELLIFLTAVDRLRPRRCPCNDQALQLHFTSSVLHSRMFRQPGDEVMTILMTKPVTVNSHKVCFTDEDFKNAGVYDKVRALSTSIDHDGLRFVSSFEHIALPFYGLQFHPEAVSYEWKPKRVIPRGPEAIKANQYFADFFVEEASRNHHHFPDVSQINQHLIYNYATTFEPSTDLPVQQLYLFTENDRRIATRRRSRKLSTFRSSA